MFMNLTEFVRKSQTHLLAVFSLLILCLLSYSNAIHNQFLIDDEGFLLQDTKLQNPKFFYFRFIPDLNKTLKIEGGARDVYYRPLAHLVPMVCLLLLGKTSEGYHIVNLIFFYLCALLIYRLLLDITQDWQLAFLTGMLFSTHPINGMMVNYITASVYGVQIASLLLAMISFIRAAEDTSAGTIVDPATLVSMNTITTRKKCFYMQSLFFYVLSLLCHETSMAFPLYVVIYLFLLSKCPLKKIVKVCIPYMLITEFYLLFRVHNASLKVSILDKFSGGHISLASYSATLANLYQWYLSKLIFLDGIVLIWVSPAMKNNLFLWNVVFLIVLIALMIILLRFWKKSLKSFALIWFLIGFAPVTMACLAYGTDFLFVEPHWFIFASIGFFLLIAIGMHYLRAFLPLRVYLLVLISVILVLVMSSRSYNYIWGNEKRYCTYWAQQTPGFKAPLFYLADSYMREGAYQQARKLYRQAIRKKSDDWQIYTNLGLMDFDGGQFQSAMENYQLALKINPWSAVIYTNIGSAYLKMNQPTEAQNAFLKALALNPYLIEPRLNLANIYRQRNDNAQAIVFLEENLKIVPDEERSLAMLLEIYLTSGRREMVFELAEKFFNKSQDPGQLTSLGSCLAQKNFVKLAMMFYSKSLKIDAANKATLLEMGALYGNLEKFDKAINLWQTGLRLYPDETKFKDLIQQAQVLMDRKTVK